MNSSTVEHFILHPKNSTIRNFVRGADYNVLNLTIKFLTSKQKELNFWCLHKKKGSIQISKTH